MLFENIIVVEDNNMERIPIASTEDIVNYVGDNVSLDLSQKLDELFSDYEQQLEDNKYRAWYDNESLQSDLSDMEYVVDEAIDLLDEILKFRDKPNNVTKRALFTKIESVREYLSENNR